MNILRKKEKKYSVVLNSTKYCTNFSTVPKRCGDFSPHLLGALKEIEYSVPVLGIVEKTHFCIVYFFSIKYTY